MYIDTHTKESMIEISPPPAELGGGDISIKCVFEKLCSIKTVTRDICLTTIIQFFVWEIIIRFQQSTMLLEKK